MTRKVQPDQALPHPASGLAGPGPESCCNSRHKEASSYSALAAAGVVAAAVHCAVRSPGLQRGLFVHPCSSHAVYVVSRPKIGIPLWAVLSGLHKNVCLELATDADYVMRRFARLQTIRCLDCTNPDVWAQIRTLMSQREVNLHKVKTHLSREAFVAQYPTSPIWNRIGNTCADNLSQQHAEQLVDQARVDGVAWVDARVRSVAEHLLAAARLWLHK